MGNTIDLILIFLNYSYKEVTFIDALNTILSSKYAAYSAWYKFLEYLSFHIFVATCRDKIAFYWKSLCAHIISEGMLWRANTSFILVVCRAFVFST